MNGSALVALIVAAACSSGSSNTVTPPPGDDGGSSGSGSGSGSSTGGSSTGGSSTGGSSTGGSSTGGSSTGGSSTGGSSSGVVPDGGCPVLPTVVLGVHIKFTVTWPASLASDTGTGPVDIWLLNDATSSGDGGLMFSGTTKSCGTNLPDIALNGVGQAAVCAPGLTCGTKVAIQILPATFDKITRTFPTTGSQTSWQPGGTLTTVKALGLLGLNATGTYMTDTTAWPASCSANCTPAGSFMASDLTDDDMDSNPGITANPKHDTGSTPTYTYPPTSTTPFTLPPLADQVYIVSRNEIQLTGMRMTDCSHGSGTAKITLFDNHVVGCHINSPAGACTTGQVSFLDTNRTIYGPDATHVASATTPINGTVTVQQLNTGATCADARAIN